MYNEKEFLKRRLEDSNFSYLLLKKYCEKMPDDSTVAGLAEDYRKKYNDLMKNYIDMFGCDTSNRV